MGGRGAVQVSLFLGSFAAATLAWRSHRSETLAFLELAVDLAFSEEFCVDAVKLLAQVDRLLVEGVFVGLKHTIFGLFQFPVPALNLDALVLHGLFVFGRTDELGDFLTRLHSRLVLVLAGGDQRNSNSSFAKVRVVSKAWLFILMKGEFF